MGTVHIGIRQDNDLVIPKLSDIKIIPDAASKGSDHRLNLIVQ